MTISTPTTPRRAAAHLHRLGANITAIPEGGKRPNHEWERWATERQPEAFVASLKFPTATQWVNGKEYPPVDTVGVISGMNGWRWFDVDAVKMPDGTKRPVPDAVLSALLTALGVPATYPWCGRSKSGAGWHVAVRCVGDLPASIADARSSAKDAGVKIGTPTAAFFDDFDHVELRWEHCQTVLPTPDGYHGVLPDDPPTEVTISQIEAAFFAVATPKPHGKGGQTPAQASPKPVAGRVVLSTGSERIDVDATVRAIDAAFDVVNWFCSAYHAETEAAPGNEIRILGQQGLMVQEDRQTWYSHTLGVGGGWVKAIALTHYSGNVPHGKDYIELLRVAASFCGVMPPEADSTAPRTPTGTAQPTAGTATPQPNTTALSRGFVLMCIREEEAGDAQLFTHLYEGRYLFDRAAGVWYAFADHIWKKQPGPPRPAVWGRVASAYLALAATLQSELETASEDDHKKLNSQIALLIGRAKSLRRLTRCNAVLTLAGDMGMLGCAGDVWDADPWVIAVVNGVLDLRTGQLRDGKPTDYIRTQAPTVWEGIDVPAPRWGQFLTEVMSEEADRVGFLQRAFGYALNGTTREHILVLLVGEQGRNGKGALFGTLRKVLGDYAASVSNDVIIGQAHNRTAGTAQPHLVSLRGKRIAYTSETADGAQMSAAQVKLITGGDAITARDLFEKQVTFAPSHTLFVATNRRPHAPADDDALWERVKVLDFKARFLDDPDPTMPNEQKRDPVLEDALPHEAPGILAWLVRGHMAYLRDGLCTPASVKLARDTYRLGESIDPFIAARCVEWDGGDAEAGSLWEAYRAWCDTAKLKAKTQHWFGRQMATRYEKGRGSTGRTVYYGVSLAPQETHKVQPHQKGSEGIRTPDNAVVPDVLTRFSEPLPPISKRCEGISLMKGNSSKTPQKVQKVQDAPTHTATATATPDARGPSAAGELVWDAAEVWDEL